ncbi:MAG: hypothetical protein HYY79_00795 [Betaproteobacteria bacterium]|nr:hypothetical protein [Betaproteobacteria bacterium]
MEQKPLIETNPYLRDREKFRKALITNVSSSAAIETTASTKTMADSLVESEGKLWAIKVRTRQGFSR